MSSLPHHETPHIDFSLLIVGAGPHALALLTKLMEPSSDKLAESPTNKVLFRRASTRSPDCVRAKYKLLPDHIFTQKDRDIRSKWRQQIEDKSRHKNFMRNVCVLDRNSSWLSQWKHQFEELKIPNLRSGISTHCDPVDTQGMRVFIEANGDRDESVVNIQLDRSVKYRGPYEVPKTHVYNKFSESIVKRYHLENTITQGTVVDVQLVRPCSRACRACHESSTKSKTPSKSESSESEPDDATTDYSTQTGTSDDDEEGMSDDDDDIPDDDDNKDKEVVDQEEEATSSHYFKVTYEDIHGAQTIVTASNVVFATGPLNHPVYPEFYAELDEEEKQDIPEGRLLHSCQIMWAHEKGRHDVDNFEKLLIIGGGLTAGHLATRAVRACQQAANEHDGSTTKRHVTLCTRRAIQSRQFDLDLGWMGRERTSRLAEFWAVKNSEERMTRLANAKNGGSMTPEVLSELSKGKQFFDCLEDTNIEYAYFDDEKQQWAVQFRDADDVRWFDTIWCATGTKIEMTQGVFQSLSRHMNIVRNRLPKLTDDLRIAEDINAFILGQHAGLTLGPGSVNLMGGRAGAARVAEALKFKKVFL